MRTKGIVWKVVVYGVGAAFVLSCVACPRVDDQQPREKKRLKLLAGATCPTPPAPVTFDIPVEATPDVLVDPDNLVIVGCEGDKVHWFSKDTTLDIAVAVEGDRAEDLFKSNETVFKSANGDIAAQTIDKPAKRAVVHKYSIRVFKPGVKKPFRVDPHVIPMGSGN
jgi:hypothetical protein